MIKTTRRERAYYSITGKDETRLIPDNISGCSVEYEIKRDGSRIPVSVDFEPMDFKGKDEDEEIEIYQKMKREANLPRTADEIRKIASMLESSLRE